MSKIFTGNRSPRIKKNVFDLSHEKKLSMNMGNLVPFYLQEVIPGDKFKVSSEQLIRLAPMLAPMMHRVNVFTHYFFVPNRLVYDKWQDFITGGPQGDLEPILPQMEINSSTYMFFGKNDISDYFGIPPTEGSSLKQKLDMGQLTPEEFDDKMKAWTQTVKVNALPFRAYQRVYNDYYRDQTLSTEIPFSKGETVDFADYPYLCSMRKRSWEKDYFTSALPWAQRGAEVLIPTVPTARAGYYPQTVVLAADDVSGLTAGQPFPTGHAMGTLLGNPPGATVLGDMEQPQYEGVNLQLDPNGLTSSGSMNDFRTANKVQVWLEKNARAGGRYIEQLWEHFKVRSSDARLQRTEYLGGGINPVVISEVISTAETQDLPQGNMAGHGISVGHDNAFTKYFEEHGYVIGIMSVLPRTAYSQGIPRHFLKNDRFDYFFPEFAHLGEQPVYTQELYQDYVNNLDPLKVFGYQSRYAEYKFHNNSVHGDFRDNMAYWHMSRQFNDEPVLNQYFVESDPTTRVFAVENPLTQHLYVQIYNKVTAIRCIPQFSTPRL